MADTARVQSIEAMKRFKLALQQFTERGRAAVDEIESDLQRTVSWLRDDQMRHWKQQLQRRRMLLTQARADLQHARMSEMKPTSGTERQAFERADRLVREAEEKLARRRQWLRVLDHDLHAELGQCRRLSDRVSVDLPRALVKLSRMIDSLDAYVNIKPQSSSDT